MGFFQEFSFDTFLGLLSCILGIVALFWGTKAYKNCKIIKESFNEHKVFKDNSKDCSQKAEGNIINNNYDVESLANISSANFEICLKQAYYHFEQQSKDNLQRIIEQTKRIIEEQKPNIAGLTKVDWINIYFESAKNTSDEYMQEVWAKVLARELAHPGSFGFKTLDILKNLTSEDFKTFERLCCLEISGCIFVEDLHSKYGISYLELVKLSEYGLINFGNSQNTYTLMPNKGLDLIYKVFLIRMKNTSEEEVSFSCSVYLLSNSAKELMEITKNYGIEEYAKDCVSFLLKQNEKICISLHRINYIIGDKVNMEIKDLYKS